MKVVSEVHKREETRDLQKLWVDPQTIYLTIESGVALHILTRRSNQTQSQILRKPESLLAKYHILEWYCRGRSETEISSMWLEVKRSLAGLATPMRDLVMYLC